MWVSKSRQALGTFHEHTLMISGAKSPKTPLTAGNEVVTPRHRHTTFRTRAAALPGLTEKHFRFRRTVAPFAVELFTADISAGPRLVSSQPVRSLSRVGAPRLGLGKAAFTEEPSGSSQAYSPQCEICEVETPRTNFAK